MTEEQKTEAVEQDKESMNTAHDIHDIRAKYDVVLGRDNILKVLYHAGVKLVLKTFSWSTIWALHGIYVVDDYIDAATKGDLSFIPFVYAGIAWFNMLLRPQLKRLVEAYAKKTEKG